MAKEARELLSGITHIRRASTWVFSQMETTVPPPESMIRGRSRAHQTQRRQSCLLSGPRRAGYSSYPFYLVTLPDKRSQSISMAILPPILLDRTGSGPFSGRGKAASVNWDRLQVETIVERMT